MCFDWLYRYKARIEKDAPGSIVEIDTEKVDGEIRFRRFFFCCLAPCITGLLIALRPYLSIDATRLTGRWEGQLAGACALDGHNWMYPLAFGFFYRETIEDWTWFLEQLEKAIGCPDNMTISSDHCKGLEVAVKNVYPLAEHRECLRHLMDNLVKNFRGSAFGKMYVAVLAVLKRQILLPTFPLKSHKIICRV